MKVIGLVPSAYRSEEKLIVEMTAAEWNCITDVGGDRKVGMTMDVAKVYQRAKSLQQNQATLATARQQLVAIASLLEPLEGVVGCDPQPEGNEAETNG